MLVTSNNFTLNLLFNFQKLLVLIWFLFGYLLSTCCSFTPVVRVCAALLGPLRGCNSCCLWFWQLVFGVSPRAATSNLPSSHNPLSNRSVLHDGRKLKTVVFSLTNALRDKHVVQICRSSLSAAMQTVQMSVEARLSTVLKSSSVMPWSQRLSLCPSPLPSFQQPGLRTSRTMGESISRIQRSPRISTSYKFAAPSYGLLPMALQTVQVSVEARLSTASPSRAVVRKAKSLPVSATTFPTAMSLYIAQGRLRKVIRPLSKLFSMAEPLPIEKEININWVYSSMPTKCRLVIYGWLTSERKASTSQS